MNSTPNSNRLHIGIFGRRNSGKSSLVNALTGQNVAIVSDVAGTTTDAVYKPMEIHGLGACVFIDTAGFDDVGELGAKRVAQTKLAAAKCDIAVVVCTNADVAEEKRWLQFFETKGVPVILVLNKTDEITNIDEVSKSIERQTKMQPVCVSAKQGTGISEIRNALLINVPDNSARESIVGTLAHEGDTVLLVMPQDIQAPKGRLILPQVQTIRDLLDKKCIVVSCTTDKIDATLAALSHAPQLIITDSQAFKTVYEKKPASSRLTSFSVLFAQYKGDIQAFLEGARAIDTLTETSHVLIAEACTHAPLAEDIGREKIPALLRKRIGSRLSVDIISGNDFPENLTKYNLVIHCGACMFNRRYVLSRIAQARAQNVPITNYGICIAHFSGILDKIVY